MQSAEPAAQPDMGLEAQESGHEPMQLQQGQELQEREAERADIAPAGEAGALPPQATATPTLTHVSLKQQRRELRQQQEADKRSRVEARVAACIASHAEQLEWMQRVPEAPVYRPSAEEWADPLAYIRSIQPEAAEYGICSIVAPVTSAVPAGLALELLRPGFRFETRKQMVRGTAWDSWDKATNPAGRTFSLREYQAEADAFSRRRMGGAPGEMRSEFAEAEFWREWEGGEGTPPTTVQYGLNVEGSAFVDGDLLGGLEWNLRRLPLHRWSTLRHLDIPVEGVSTPMLYIGMLFSYFAWHVEDHHLHSINYQHQGTAKTWYGVPASAADAFEEVARDKVYKEAVAAMVMAGASEQEVSDQVAKSLQNKTTMFSPRLLLDAGVPVHRAVQRPGTFVVTFPRAMHAGFGHGYNLGEAVNFGMPEWWPYAATSRQLYKRQCWGHCITHEQVLCTDALQLREQVEAADRAAVAAAGAYTPAHPAAAGPRTPAGAQTRVAAGEMAAEEEEAVQVVVTPVLRPRDPSARLAELRAARERLAAEEMAAQRALAAEREAQHTAAAANAVAHTFVDMLRRLHHCRALLEGAPGAAVVVTACSSMRAQAGRSSLHCSKCADQCYLCTAVLDARGSPDVWAHLCLECAAAQVQQRSAGAAAQGGGSAGGGGASSAVSQQAPLVVFVKPIWGQLVECAQALEARGIRPLTEQLRAPLPLAGLQPNPVDPPYSAGCLPPPHKPYGWAPLAEPAAEWPSDWLSAADLAGAQLPTPPKAWFAALAAQAQAQAASDTAAAAEVAPRPGGRRLRIMHATPAPKRPRPPSTQATAASAPGEAPRKRPRRAAAAAAAADEAGAAAEREEAAVELPTRGQGIKRKGAPVATEINTPSSALVLASLTEVEVVGQRLVRRVYTLPDGGAAVPAKDCLTAAGVDCPSSTLRSLAQVFSLAGMPQTHFTKAYVAGGVGSALMLDASQAAVLARCLPQQQSARLGAFLKGVWPEDAAEAALEPAPSPAMPAAAKPEAAGAIDVDAAGAGEQQEQQEQQGSAAGGSVAARQATSAQEVATARDAGSLDFTALLNAMPLEEAGVLPVHCQTQIGDVTVRGYLLQGVCVVPVVDVVRACRPTLTYRPHGAEFLSATLRRLAAAGTAKQALALLPRRARCEGFTNGHCKARGTLLCPRSTLEALLPFAAKTEAPHLAQLLHSSELWGQQAAAPAAAASPPAPAVQQQVAPGTSRPTARSSLLPPPPAPLGAASRRRSASRQRKASKAQTSAADPSPAGSGAPTSVSTTPAPEVVRERQLQPPRLPRAVRPGSQAASAASQQPQDKPRPGGVRRQRELADLLSGIDTMNQQPSRSPRASSAEPGGQATTHATHLGSSAAPGMQAPEPLLPKAPAQASPRGPSPAEAAEQVAEASEQLKQATPPAMAAEEEGASGAAPAQGLEEAAKPAALDQEAGEDMEEGSEIPGPPGPVATAPEIAGVDSMELCEPSTVPVPAPAEQPAGALPSPAPAPASGNGHTPVTDQPPVLSQLAALPEVRPPEWQGLTRSPPPLSAESSLPLLPVESPQPPLPAGSLLPPLPSESSRPPLPADSPPLPMPGGHPPPTLSSECPPPVPPSQLAHGALAHWSGADHQRWLAVQQVQWAQQQPLMPPPPALWTPEQQQPATWLPQQQMAPQLAVASTQAQALHAAQWQARNAAQLEYYAQQQRQLALRQAAVTTQSPPFWQVQPIAASTVSALQQAAQPPRAPSPSQGAVHAHQALQPQMAASALSQAGAGAAQGVVHSPAAHHAGVAEQAARADQQRQAQAEAEAAGAQQAAAAAARPRQAAEQARQEYQDLRRRVGQLVHQGKNASLADLESTLGLCLPPLPWSEDYTFSIQDAWRFAADLAPAYVAAERAWFAVRGAAGGSPTGQ